LPRPHPVESAPVPAEERSAEPRNSDPRPGEPKATDPVVAPPRVIGVPAAANSNVLRPPAPIPALSRGDSAAATRRVIAVQRALAQLGYGQLKPTGTVGSDTQAAIQKFERARKLPVTGQISDRLVHELVVMVGHPIE
jgi:peptidoglycan hydrolase-like protein with peptidoglycan-binding domain